MPMSTTTALNHDELEASQHASTMVVLATNVAIAFQLLRLSIDLIQVASEAPPKNEDKKDTGKKNETGANSYGSTDNTNDINKTRPASSSCTDEEQQALLQSSEDSNAPTQQPTTFSATTLPRLSLVLHVVLCAVFLVVPLVNNNSAKYVFSSTLNECSALVLFLGTIQGYRDLKRKRFGIFQRSFYLGASSSLWLTYMFQCFWAFYVNGNDSIGSVDTLLLIAVTLFWGTSLVDCCVTSHTLHRPTAQELAQAACAAKKRARSIQALTTMLKPYFWPDATDTSAILNRVRAILTWVCVVLSKICNLGSPILLGWASTALAHQDYTHCIQWSICYCILQFFASTFKEGQSLIYLKVAQAAFVQLSEAAFGHIHNLSLDWHLRKKLGEVMRSMDRGIAACDTLMKYLFLWLLPALIECLVVCIIFASYFQYLPLGVSVFYFVFVYIVWTILVTLWRKKFRTQVAKSDNEFHDICTDSLIQFETVKYFTAEDWEMKRYGNAVKRYQQGSVNVQASLSFLNVSQGLIMQSCLATSLSLAAYGIKKRSDCCIQQIGCDSLFSDCCQSTDNVICPGMEVGDFVAVLTYTLNLFQPLNFLGSVYNAIVMAIIDLQSLEELLAESPDVTDDPGAKCAPKTNEREPDVAVEFDDVYFHYPTQADTQGLRGLSFKMKRGTTTAIVGPTGAGKTTVSRLLFRFYDVLGGSVKVNGVDVRSVTQKSLREMIGVVPQSASMFNTTLRDNLLYGKRDATDDELVQAARDAQLINFVESLPDKWETMVGDRGLKLSGGEKQRAAIARCLLKDPPFVLLDEATSALDTLTEKSVQDALDRLGSSRTVLIIAHRLGTIRNADNIVVMKDGKVAEQGTHDQLLSKPGGLYADMWNMQLHSSGGYSRESPEDVSMHA